MNAEKTVIATLPASNRYAGVLRNLDAIMSEYFGSFSLCDHPECLPTDIESLYRGILMTARGVNKWKAASHQLLFAIAQRIVADDYTIGQDRLWLMTNSVSKVNNKYNIGGLGFVTPVDTVNPSPSLRNATLYIDVKSHELIIKE